MKNNLKIDNFLEKLDIPSMEEAVLDYWDSVDAFKKSIEIRPEDKPYIFYDGPPFATGKPHYGHLLASTIKDVVPRYFTMKGHKIERVWGWDCHGLPIENMIEKQLDLKGGKKGIEKLGIDKFNSACRNEVLKLDKEWEQIIHRLGRWVDFENNYKTMDTNYMESVWWAFKTLYDKDHIYKGRRVILYCPRCATPLSNFEIAMDNSYKDVSDHSVFIKFKIKEKKNEYLLAWTTTPWTLIGNVGLAVNPDLDYIKVKVGEEYLYLAENKKEILPEGYQVVETIKGSDLEGMDYEPLYNYLDIKDKKAYYVSSADFVSLEEGTGIVHTAAMYGEDDYQLALKINLPLVEMLDDQGKFMDFVEPLKGMFYKKSEGWIVDDLTKRNLMFKSDTITHSYPHCYRCETPLYYTAVPAWFVNIKKIKPEMTEQNENINWYPNHLKHGRFGKGLKSAPDWNISRSRYWGTPMPIWQSDSSDSIRVIGSIEELQTWAVDPKEAEGITDIHREFIDHIKVWIDDDKKEQGTRIPEVFDCWIESGSMPYASEHYPFENKEKFESRHPAQFIAEYIAQTRAWFYTLHVMSVGLFGKNTFENAVTTGTIQAEDGSKMSKSKKNFPDPSKLMNELGVDSLRLYLMSSPIMRAENLNFSEREVADIKRKVFNIWWNVFTFYQLYADKSQPLTFPDKVDHVMDAWLITKTESLTKDVLDHMDNYDVVSASREMMDFVNDLSTWYLRTSRNRLRSKDNSQSSRVFGTAIYRLSLLFAPFTPFFSELMYQNLNVEDKKESIHHELLPTPNTSQIDDQLDDEMKTLRKVVESAHAQRQLSGFKLKQPLAKLFVSSKQTIREDLYQVLKDEINVLKVEWDSNSKEDNIISTSLDLVLTDELKAMGQVRQIISQIQKQRKKLGVAYDQLVNVELPDWPKAHEEEIKEKVLAKTLKKSEEFKVVSV